MKKNILFLALLLAACNAGASLNTNQQIVIEESDEPIELPEAPTEPVPVAQALNTTFTSKTLGISFKYPSIMYGDCERPFSIEAREGENFVEFVQVGPVEKGCEHLKGEHFAKIFTLKAGEDVDKDTGAEVFVGNVFPPECSVASKEQYEKDGDEYMNIFVHETNPPKDRPDFCSEVVTWNRTAGVMLFSILGSKNGGGYDWPYKMGITLPDGSIEYGADFAIMNSMKYLK